jgi:hypothetical protein
MMTKPVERKTRIFSRIITSTLVCIILCGIPALGCASRSLVPISDSGIAYPELRRASKTLGDVTVVINSSPWEGSPDYLGRYITPIYVEIQNNGSSSLNIRYDDFVLIDQNRTQYNALTPQFVADALKSVSEGYAYGPYYPPVSIGLGFGYFSGGPFYGSWPYYGPFYSPFYIYGDYPFGYYPPAYYSPPSVGNVYTKALVPGQVIPNAKLQGYIYFQKLPKEVSLATLNVGYRFVGEPVNYKLSFPFEYK